MAVKTFTGSATDAVAAKDTFDINTKVTITGADYTAEQLKAINTVTNEKIVLQKVAAPELSDTLANLEAALDGIKYTGAITVTGTTIADIDTALQLTTGKVTAIVAGALAADLVEALTPSATAKDVLTLKLTDTDPVAASVLKALDAKTSVAVDASDVTEITGTATELKTVLAANTAATPTITLDLTAVNLTVDGKVSAADLNAFAKATDGVVTADIEGSAAALNAALKDVDSLDSITVTLTGTSAIAKDLIELHTKVDLDVSSLKTITGTFADIGTVTTTYPSEVTVTITDTVTIADVDTTVTKLNTIATNAGVVKATVEGAATELVKLTTTNSDLLTLKVTDASVTAANLITIDGKTSVKVDASAVTSITDTAANLKTIYASKTISGLGNEAVEITDAKPSAKDVNVILKATTGVVKATVEDTATNLVKALTDAKATDVLALTVTGTATAAELKALDAKASTVTATAVTEITGNAKDVIAVLTADGIDLVGTVAVKVTGTVSASDANIIAGLTGKVTATVADGTAADLNAKLIDANGLIDALTLRVNGKTATAADLNDLNSKTLVDVKVDATEVTGKFTDLNAVYVTNKANFRNLGNETVKITDETVTATDANTIANATTGKVTATVDAADAATLVGALGAAAATDALTLTVDNTVAAAASDLILLDGKTSVDVIVNATTVTGTFAELNKVYVANKANFAALGNEAVTITDATVSAAQANTIANATTGVVTAKVADATAASLNAALKNAAADGSDELTLTVNGATATAADLNALDGKTNKIITVDAKAVTGTFADLNKVYVTNAANFAALGNEAVTITDKTVAVTDANTIATAVTTGKVTATVTAGTSAVLDALTTVETDAITLTVTGDATALELNSLDGKTSVDVKVDATKVTGNYTDLYEMYVTNKANFANLGNENITMTDGTAAQVNTIASLTTGKVTAIISDTAANLVAALKNSTGDVLSLTVNGATAKAADLITLDGKTAEKITVDAGTAITGTYAELYKVYQTNALNFKDLGTQNVTITDKVTVDQINVIKELATAKVTAAVSGSAADLAKLSTVGTDAITLTVSGTTAAATDLNILNGKTSVPVNAASVTTITGDAAAVKTLYAASSDFTGLGNEAVTVSGTATVIQAEAITGATTGKVTATVTDTADQLLNITNAVSSDALTLTATDATAAAAKLNTLDGKTSVAVKVDATAVEGTYSDLSKVYVTNKANFTGLGNETVTISGEVSAAQANTIALATTGAVTATTVAAASAATLNAALTDTTVNAYSLTLTDTNLSSLTNLIALDGKTTGTINAGSLKTISETFDHLNTVFTSDGITGLTDQAVTITDTQSAANVNTFALETIGHVTATIKDGAVASTLAAITNVAAADVITFKTTDTTVDASNLVDLKVKVDTFNTASVTKITEDAVSVSNVANALDILGADTQTTAVEITGGAISAADLNTIATNTAGVVTATLAANTDITDAIVGTTLAAVAGTDVVSLTSSVEIADATALVALAGKVSTADAIAFNSVATITEAFDTATLTTVIANALAITGQATNVKITDGTITKTAFDLIDTNTTGSIDVSGITLAANDASAINLANLSSVTGLLTLNTVDADAAGGNAINVITGSNAGAITTADILALTGTTLTDDANDAIALAITGDTTDTINLTGWNETAVGSKVYTNVVTDGAFSDTYTITLTGVVLA